MQRYGTPGIGAIFIGKEKSTVSKARRAAWNLFEKFADCKYVVLYKRYGILILSLKVQITVSGLT